MRPFFNQETDDGTKEPVHRQIIRALREVDAGAKPADVCRKLGVTETTFFRWRRKYGGLEVNEAKRLRQLEEENNRLKKLLADQMLDNAALKAALAKKW